MRQNFGAKTWLYPMPVLIIASYNENGSGEAMNAAWGGISDTNEISMDVSAGHKTVKSILKKKAFSVSVGTVEHMKECDYLGMVSGNEEPNKLQKAGLHLTKSDFVDAPVIEELPMTLECELISYDPNTGIMKGRIVNISADETILTEGKIDPSKLHPISFDPVNNKYLSLGEIVGNAFKDGLQLK